MSGDWVTKAEADLRRGNAILTGFLLGLIFGLALMAATWWAA